MLYLLPAILLQTSVEPSDLRLIVGSAERTAVVYPGSRAHETASPVVFVFHGLTGNSRQAARSYSVHREWPEATVVYPQGLEIDSPLLGIKAPGWQFAPGQSDDRDLKFFDALLESLAKDYKVDLARVYSCGMSNGAYFTFALMAKRPEKIAAFASVGGAAGLWLRDASTPRPVLIIHGESDALVPVSVAERTRDACIRLNGNGADEKEWQPGYTTYEPAKESNRVVWHKHPGGHVWPAAATKHIVMFFKEHSLSNPLVPRDAAAKARHVNALPAGR